MLSLTWNWQSRLLSIDWPFSPTPCLSLAFDTYPGTPHGMRTSSLRIPWDEPLFPCKKQVCTVRLKQLQDFAPRDAHPKGRQSL